MRSCGRSHADASAGLIDGVAVSGGVVHRRLTSSSSAADSGAPCDAHLAMISRHRCLRPTPSHAWASDPLLKQTMSLAGQCAFVTIAVAVKVFPAANPS